MELMDAKQYLTHLRKMTGYYDTRDFVDRYIQKNADGYFVTPDGNIMPNEYADYRFRYPEIILNNMYDELEAAGIDVIEKPLLGNIGLHDINARAMRAPNSDPMILLDMYLPLVLDTLCISLLIMGYEFGSRGFSKVFFRKVQKTIITSVKVLLRGTSCLSLDMVPDWMTNYEPSGVLGVGRTISNMILFFILAHEYSHFSLGHLSSPTEKTHRLTIESHEFEVHEISHKNELLADANALTIFMLCANSKSSLSLFRQLNEYIFAPMLLFDFVALAESDKTYHDRIHITHPRASERKEQFSKKLNCTGAVQNLYELMSDIIPVFCDFIRTNGL